MIIKRKQSGFTLIELLVVIAIIALLSSTILASLNSSRIKARNASRVAVINQFITALQFSYDEDGDFPGNTTWRCIADHPDNKCWHRGGTGISEEAGLSAALERFLNPRQPDTMILGGWEGVVYRHCKDDNDGDHDCRKGGVTMRWFMEGTDQSCGPGKVLNANYKGRNITYCKVILQ